MSQMAEGQLAAPHWTGIDPTVARRIAAARAGDQHEFSGLTEPYRRELQLHCYRILGSLQDAEDTVQETLLRAWRRLDTFEGRASLRAWLYKIATHACFDALDKRPRRRVLPTAQYPPADPYQPMNPPVTEPIWLEPYPDDLIAEPESGPEARYSQRESVSLAFLAALQSLPPRQRAVLILCDVLDWRAREAAQLVGRGQPEAREVVDGRSQPAGGDDQAGPGQRVMVRNYLRQAGYRIATSISDARDVVLPTVGIESWVEVHNWPAETGRVHRHPTALCR